MIDMSNHQGELEQKTQTDRERKKSPQGKIIQLDDKLDHVQQEILAADFSRIHEQLGENNRETMDLALRMEQLAEEMKGEADAPVEMLAQVRPDAEIRGRNPCPDLVELETELDECCSQLMPNVPARSFPKLSEQEVVLASVAGLMSVAIDVFLVGTPEVVKVYRGGERFDGSVLTGLLRKIGNSDDPLSKFFKWLSDNCKVPYDISAQSGVVMPNNHRLRSVSHDPFFGLFFAIVDIWMGTTTCVDDKGRLTILINSKKYPPQQKILAVPYYIGHIFSDLCTARGIPIPGFFLTQFFTRAEADGEVDRFIAGIAEDMYKDGYDMRHLVSMSVPVAVKDLVIKGYLSLTKPEINRFLPIAEKERAELNQRLKKEEMLLIANSVATTGNLLKFVSPPNCGNPCALNLPQWVAFIKNGINMLRGVMRDKSVETVMDHREEINAEWQRLLQKSTCL